jgi:heme exporter protein D
VGGRLARNQSPIQKDFAMIWNSAADFWAMGGYGFYVWGSFGVTALLMALEVGWVRQQRQRALAQVAAESASEQGLIKDWQS